MIGIPVGYGFALLLTVLLSLVALAYVLLWLLPTSRFGRSPARSVEQQALPNFHKGHAIKPNRAGLAVIAGLVWFVLWVSIVKILFSYPLPYHNVLSRAFGYATVALWGTLAAIWVGLKFLRRARDGNVR